MPIVDKIYKKAQSIKSWAFLIWALVLCNLSALSLIDNSFHPVALLAATLVLTPFNLSNHKRALLVVLSGALLYFGPQAAVLITPIVLLIAGFVELFAISGLVLLSMGILLPQIQSININFAGWIPLSSLAFIILPTLSTAVILDSLTSKTQKRKLILISLLSLVFVGLIAENWLQVSALSNPYFRIFLVLLPILGVFSEHPKPLTQSSLGLKPFLIALVLGCVAPIFIHSEKIKTIIFDEAHGHWETVLSSFTPDDFGRNANYTYSQLFSYSKHISGQSLGLDEEEKASFGKDALFVIKMPAKPLSEAFSQRLAQWVKEGGRLLVVADHTDLYDTTQNINQFLTQYFDTKINSDAVYDYEGMPNAPMGYLSGMLLGRANANNKRFAWQTGSSFNYLPYNAIELASFGLSFAEQGDYSRPNRFGPFVPSVKNRFINHSAAITFSSGKGAVAVILDSTPWSNFSIFIDQYKHLFKSLVKTLEMPAHLRLLGLAGYCLLFLGVAFYLIPSKVSYPLAGFIIGLTLTVGTLIGFNSLSNMHYGRDFVLKVTLGKEAKLEFLHQLVNPGEQNFSRIISAMGKYSLSPVASSPGEMPGPLLSSKQWLFINPDSEQLPSLEALRAHLTSGGNVTILFSKHQASSKEVLAWLNSLSMFTKNNIGLKVLDSSKSLNGSYLNGRTPALGREITVVALAKPTSFFSTVESGDLVQTFSLRPTKLPRTSGLLNISFVAEQFSDDAIGDVWEGVDPSTMGVLREQQLAAIILGKDIPNQYPESLVKPTPSLRPVLTEYLVIQDGETKIYGKLPFKTSQDPVEAKFQNLRALAENFVQSNCPATAKVTKCKSRLLDSNYVEWIVSWKPNNSGGATSIELVHDRRMAGLGSSWNVIFGR